MLTRLEFWHGKKGGDMTNRGNGLQRMRRVATGALVLMAVLFAVAKTLEVRSLVWGYVAAFAGAAMVGALADWFAVVALFRHPLGLPIPHTAVLPTNKDRIGKTLATFLVSNFLTRDAIGHRLERVDLTAQAAAWLEGNAASLATRILGCSPALVNAVKDEDVQRLLHATIMVRLRAIEVAPLAGKALAVLTAGERIEDLLEMGLRVAETLVHENHAFISRQVRDRLPLPDLPLISSVKDTLAEAISKKVVDAITATLRDARYNPSHPLRVQFREKAKTLAESLQASPEYRAKGEAIKAELLQHPAIGEYVADVWADLKQRLQADLASPSSQTRARVEQLLTGLGSILLEDQALRSKLNGWLRAGVLDWVEAHGAEVGHFIQDRVARWDGDLMSRKLEEAVGRDLQYIRLNGTLVGGTVGLLLYVASNWIW
jgi:uncharacterized membrane-anchored protein YjiN (DUF445 family)